jgi:hypothetical protein
MNSNNMTKVDDSYSKIFSNYQPRKLVKRRKTNVSRTISVLVLRVLIDSCKRKGIQL